MHRKLLLLIFLFSLSSLNAQIFNENNSLMRKALVLYQKDAKGFYQKTENVSRPVVNNISESYAYDKKAQELYVQTANGNYVITVDKDNAKIYKKSKSIPQLKGDELTAAITKINQSLASKFERLNIERQRYIDDSIRIAKEDSIRRAKEDSIRRKKAEQYRQAHRWLDVPTKGISLKCAFCDERTYNDSIFCVRATTDSIFWATKREDELLRSDKYRYHYEIFKDSLNKGISCDTGFDYSKETVDEFNDLSLRGGIRKIVSEAPYGFGHHGIHVGGLGSVAPAWGHGYDCAYVVGFEFLSCGRGFVNAADRGVCDAAFHRTAVAVPQVLGVEFG